MSSIERIRDDLNSDDIFGFGYPIGISNNQVNLDSQDV